jgi:alpha-tubulin suppressor-like RCC1 family protein
LGRDAPIQIRTPTRVGDDNDWQLVRTAQSQTCAIKEDQSLWCWGSGTSGQLGVDPAIIRKTPTRVGTDNDWVNVEPQALHTCGLREDNSLWCWGRRQEGQLTLGYDPNPILTPLLVDANSDWDLLSCGRFHTCGRRANVLYCTGENIDGRLGDGTLVRSYGFVPVQAF